MSSYLGATILITYARISLPEVPGSDHWSCKMGKGPLVRGLVCLFPIAVVKFTTIYFYLYNEADADILYLQLSPMGAFGHPNTKPTVLFGTPRLACTTFVQICYDLPFNAVNIDQSVKPAQALFGDLQAEAVC